MTGYAHQKLHFSRYISSAILTWSSKLMVVRYTMGSDLQLIGARFSNFLLGKLSRELLCYRTVVCPVLSCLSVALVYCGQTIRWSKMKLGLMVGLGPGHIVLGGDQAPLPQRGTAPQFSAHICCGQIAGWVKMALGRKVGLIPVDVVLDGAQLPLPQKGGRALQFSAHVYYGQTVVHLSCC